MWNFLHNRFSYYYEKFEKTKQNYINNFQDEISIPYEEVEVYSTIKNNTHGFLI